MSSDTLENSCHAVHPRIPHPRNTLSRSITSGDHSRQLRDGSCVVWSFARNPRGALRVGEHRSTINSCSMPRGAPSPPPSTPQDPSSHARSPPAVFRSNSVPIFAVFGSFSLPMLSSTDRRIVPSILFDLSTLVTVAIPDVEICVVTEWNAVIVPARRAHSFDRANDAA